MNQRASTFTLWAAVARAPFTFLAFMTLLATAHADELRYQAVWSAGTGSNIITEPLSRAAFLTRGEALTAQGLRLVDVETQVVDGQRCLRSPRQRRFCLDG